MAKEIRRRELEKALISNGCSGISDRGEHTKWGCPCEEHTANIPRHNMISPGVVASTIKRMACLPKGWLQ